MASIILVVAVVVLLSWLYYYTSRPKNFPPGPLGYPILGSALNIDRKKIYDTYASLYKQYGSVVGIVFGWTPVIMINGWEAVKEALNNDNLNYRPKFLVSTELYPGEQKGVMLVNGDDWKTQRRFTLHHFRNLGFGKRSHESVIQEESHHLVEQLLKVNGPVDVKVPIGVSLINILWALMGGKRHNHDDPMLKRLVGLVNRGMRSGQITGGVINTFPFLRFIAPDYFGYTQIRTAFADIKTFVQEAVVEHQKNFNPDEINDFMDIYIQELRKKDIDPSFTEQQMIAIIGDLFTAGTETGSSLVSFAVLFLCKYPTLQAKMQEQLDQVVGVGNVPTLDHRSRLTRVDAFLNETTRLRLPLPVTIPHFAMADTTVQGKFITKGVRVMINLNSVMLDREYWGDPETFRPERFILPDGSLKKEERLIAFGKGKRACLGESLARMTTFLLLATMVHRLKFKFAPGPEPSDQGITGFTQGPENFCVLVEERH